MYPIFSCLGNYLHESFKSEFKDSWLACPHLIIIGKLLGSVIWKGNHVEGNTLVIPLYSFLTNNRKETLMETVKVV